MKCPHCHVEMHGLDHHTMILAEDMDGWWGVIRQKCPACERLIFELACGQTRTSGNGDLIGSAAKKRILAYPRSGARTPPTEVPDKFADDFKEAAIVLSDSPKASAALGRRCLQNILHNHLGIRKANLSQEIDELLKTPGFPSHLAEAVDGVRIIGNFAAHPLKSTAAGTIIDVEPGEADWTLDVLDGLFDFYFVQPEILKKRRDNLNAKLAAAGKPPMK